jgi:CheY-like chemotaxis protein
MTPPELPPNGPRLTLGVPKDQCGRGERVLHIDDEPAGTSMFCRMLVKLGYRVESFNLPASAVERLRTDPLSFDVVITDLMMPDMNGLEVANAVRRLRPDLPVILLSAFSASFSSTTIRANGICEIIEKPAPINTLAAVLRRVLDRPTLQA